MMRLLFDEKNKEISLSLLLIVSLIIHFFYPSTNLLQSTWENGAPIVQLFNIEILRFLNIPFLNAIFSLSLSLFQFFLIYKIVGRFKIINKHRLTILWVYLILLSFHPIAFQTSPSKIAYTLTLLILKLLYDEFIQQGNRTTNLFTIASLIGLNFLLWYPSILLLPFVLFYYFQQNQLRLKSILILALSFLIPIVWLLIYFLIDYEFVEIFYLISNFHTSAIHLPYMGITSILIGGIYLLISLFGLIMSWNFKGLSIKATRIFIYSQIVFLILMILGLFLSVNHFIESIYYLFFPLSILIAIFLNIFKHKILTWLIPLFLFLCFGLNFAYHIFKQFTYL